MEFPQENNLDAAQVVEQSLRGDLDTLGDVDNMRMSQGLYREEQDQKKHGEPSNELREDQSAR
jgi:hypothetical protein